ncbi:hypothetical protein LY76DRAFT_419809 [Colletotrichum caudatum]|nr:hypothetical protein LY76DRAFT_419809 [Colletotrichum caudatum]
MIAFSRSFADQNWLEIDILMTRRSPVRATLVGLATFEQGSQVSALCRIGQNDPFQRCAKPRSFTAMTGSNGACPRKRGLSIGRCGGPESWVFSLTHVSVPVLKVSNGQTDSLAKQPARRWIGVLDSWPNYPSIRFIASILGGRVQIHPSLELSIQCWFGDSF